MKRYIYFLSVIALSAAGACTPTSNEGGLLTDGKAQQVQYFDPTKFINTQDSVLTALGLGVLKLANLNGEPDTALIAKPDWGKELSVFEVANLNKPALIGTYKIDTAYLAHFVTYTYTTLSDKNPVKKLVQTNIAEINELVGLYVVEETENNLLSSRRELEMRATWVQPNYQLVEFKIKTKQKTQLGEETMSELFARPGYPAKSQ